MSSLTRDSTLFFNAELINEIADMIEDINPLMEIQKPPNMDMAHLNRALWVAQLFKSRCDIFHGKYTLFMFSSMVATRGCVSLEKTLSCQDTVHIVKGEE